MNLSIVTSRLFAVALAALCAANTGCSFMFRNLATDGGGGESYDENESNADDGAEASTAVADNDPSALTVFRADLEPHGRWVDNTAYGTVWIPNESEVGPDFAPYVTAGRWGYDDGQYVWISDYSWGWAPFHYGRWVWITGYGWSWIPGRTYAGAWVNWRVGTDGYAYVGWAPMPPTYYYWGGTPMTITSPPPAPYVFCGRSDLFSPRVSDRVLAKPQVAQVAPHTRPYLFQTSPVGTGGAPQGASVAPRGPTPVSLHIPDSSVRRVTASDAQITRAKLFARPTAPAGPRVGGPSRYVSGPSRSGYSAPSQPGARTYYPANPGPRTARPPSHSVPRAAPATPRVHAPSRSVSKPSTYTTRGSSSKPTPSTPRSSPRKK